MELDKWQKEVLETEGNIVLRSGRQVGKSFVISIKAAEYAVQNPKKTVLMIASVERQAYLLFEKTLAYLMEHHKNCIKRGRLRPTKSKVMLKNGSTIYCLPTGLTGYGIRGYTVNLLIADEAAFIPEEVWTAVTPMLAVTKGKMILLSTPHGRGGYFYDCFNDESFTSFHVSGEDCPRRDDQFLARQLERLGKLRYAQEHLGEFIDELRQFFTDDLIKQVCVLKRTPVNIKSRYALGVDIARMGEDASTFEILDYSDSKSLKHIDNIVTRKTLTTETTRKILQLEREYRFTNIYIDDGGLGVGVFDQLLEEDETKRKVRAINNARRSLDRDKKKNKKLLKEDLYNNLLRLMERGDIELLDDDEIAASLKSIQFEYTGMKEGEESKEKSLRIWGKDSHITEGLIRAAWIVKDKSLNIYIY